MSGRHLLQALAGAILTVHLCSTICDAQTIGPGTFELSGVSGLTANRQTVSMADAAGQLTATNINVTSIIFGVESTYYLTRRFGIGGVINHQRLSAESPDQHAVSKAAFTYFGPFAQLRLPLGGRSTFALVGSYGGTMVALINQNTGVGTDEHLTANGKYWLAGGALSVELSPKTSFDFGVRYQASRFKGTPGTGTTTGSTTGHTSSAGLLVSLAFSWYVGG